MKKGSNGGMSCNMCNKSCQSCMIYCLILLLGVTFLASNMGWISSGTAGIIWPILLILAALIPIIKGKCN